MFCSFGTTLVVVKIKKRKNCFIVAIPCYQLKALICLIYVLLYGWNCHGTYINWDVTPATEGEGHASSVPAANGRETVGINRGANNHHQEGTSARRRRRQRQNRRANNDQGQAPESAQYREEPSR